MANKIFIIADNVRQFQTLVGPRSVIFNYVTKAEDLLGHERGNILLIIGSRTETAPWIQLAIEQGFIPFSQDFNASRPAQTYAEPPPSWTPADQLARVR